MGFISLESLSPFTIDGDIMCAHHITYSTYNSIKKGRVAAAVGADITLLMETRCTHTHTHIARGLKKSFKK